MRNFNIGSELDKQIYKEGDSTWGLKSGFLDVEDVQLFIQEVKNEINKFAIHNTGIHKGFLCMQIDKIAGKKCVLSESSEDGKK